MDAEIHPLDPARDASGCDAVIGSLPYHFGDPGGVRDCAGAVRTQRGLVARDNGEIVAFATTAPASSQAMEITWLAVHAKRRRRGLGRRLVERAAADATRAGFTLLFALTQAPSEPEPGVDDGYEGTRWFWQRLGFVPVKELDLSDWPVTALLMIRPLRAAGRSPEAS